MCNASDELIPCALLVVGAVILMAGKEKRLMVKRDDCAASCFNLHFLMLHHLHCYYLYTMAHLLPKVRSQFARFLNDC
jgi:hypothetical protein